MAKISSANPLPYINDRQLGDIYNIKSQFFNGRLRVAKNLFKKDLICHYGCVNAIEFSDDGQYLISGGDDRRVILWKFGEALFDRSKPEQMLSLHFSNIFCLAITPDNGRIYSGGNDNNVVVHDTHTKGVIEVLPHNKAVCGIAIDPFSSRVLATAGNDGRLLVFDTRQSVNESLVVSRSRKAFHAVAFHPTQTGIIVAANARDGANLWDLRKPKHPIIKYGSSSGVSQNCMSVRFDSTGARILALRRRLPPAMYSIDSSEPTAHFYHPDYYNSCTVKSCCFAGDRDQFVLSGSDDFNLYMWRVSDTPDTWVDKTHMVLYGHRSIVNQVRYNPQYCIVASSGVEKIIKTWSPIEIPGSRGSLLEEQSGPDNPRDLYSHEGYVSLVHDSEQYVTHYHGDQSTNEDPRMMAFFDSLVQREMEGWSSEDTDSMSGDTNQINTHRLQPAASFSQRLAAAVRTVEPSQPRPVRGSDTTDSEDMYMNICPTRSKRAAGSNTLRNQRCPNRIARLVATRHSKLLSLAVARKRNSSSNRQNSKSRLMCTFGGVATQQRCLRAIRALRARYGQRRRSVPSKPPTANNSVFLPNTQPRSDTDADSDTPPSPRPPANRHVSKMTRSNRRRMSIPRNYKHKPKTLCFRPNGGDLRNGNGRDHLDDSTYSEDNLAVPSTSTGIRGHHNVALFRINEADSDDDQSSGGCSKSPLDDRQSSDCRNLSPVETPVKGSCDKSTNGFQIDFPTWQNAQNDRYNIEHNAASANGYYSENDVRQISLTDWDSRSDRILPYTPTLARLRNETNESEVESSYGSTESALEEISSPNKHIPLVESATPDSGVHDHPCNSSGNRTISLTSRHVREMAADSNREPDNQDLVIVKQRQRVKRARRKYRVQMGDSDST